MDCKSARDACHALCDGELPPVERAALALHCERCSECLAFVREMDAVAAGLAELRAKTSRVGEPASGAMPGRRSFKWAPAAGRAAAAVALILGTGIIAYLATVDGEHRPSVVMNSSAPIASPSSEPPGRTPAVQVALRAESDERFIPVTQKTSRPNVHLFVLFERP